jgi:predicted Fe-Mo cluster-binding NifX family protein
MKAAITAKSNILDCELEPVFENAKYFIIFDTYTPEEIKIIPNLYSGADDCSDIFASSFIINEGVEMLATGKCNPATQKILWDAGIIICYNSEDKIGNIIKRVCNINAGITCSKYK